MILDDEHWLGQRLDRPDVQFLGRVGHHEYEHVLVYLAHQRSREDPLRVGDYVGGLPYDVHALVETEIGTDVVVVPGSMIHVVGGPLDELARYLMEADDA